MWKDHMGLYILGLAYYYCPILRKLQMAEPTSQSAISSSSSSRSTAPSILDVRSELSNSVATYYSRKELDSLFKNNESAKDYWSIWQMIGCLDIFPSKFIWERKMASLAYLQVLEQMDDWHSIYIMFCHVERKDSRKRMADMLGILATTLARSLSRVLQRSLSSPDYTVPPVASEGKKTKFEEPYSWLLKVAHKLYLSEQKYQGIVTALAFCENTVAPHVAKSLSELLQQSFFVFRRNNSDPAVLKAQEAAEIRLSEADLEPAVLLSSIRTRRENNTARSAYGNISVEGIDNFCGIMWTRAGKRKMRTDPGDVASPQAKKMKIAAARSIGSTAEAVSSTCLTIKETIPLWGHETVNSVQ
tara:strand:+ start:1509 stop:2585 length:1077 start_codon:yes stop_codon:yes gene_type:complete